MTAKTHEMLRGSAQELAQRSRTKVCPFTRSGDLPPRVHDEKLISGIANGAWSAHGFLGGESP
ncbi:hypothetical protein ACWD4T_28130 [Streptomyces umbrinus]